MAAQWASSIMANITIQHANTTSPISEADWRGTGAHSFGGLTALSAMVVNSAGQMQSRTMANDTLLGQVGGNMSAITIGPNGSIVGGVLDFDSTGDPGPQGDPGPNEVSTSTNTTFTGLLFGDGAHVQNGSIRGIANQIELSNGTPHVAGDIITLGIPNEFIPPSSVNTTNGTLYAGPVSAANVSIRGYSGRWAFFESVTGRLIEADLPQDISPSAAVTFSGLTLTGFGGVVIATAGVLSAVDVGSIAFTPTTGSNWDGPPATIQAALDELAARVKALEP